MQPRGPQGRGCGTLDVRFSTNSCHLPASSEQAEAGAVVSGGTLEEDRVTQTKWRESPRQQVTTSPAQ